MREKNTEIGERSVHEQLACARKDIANLLRRVANLEAKADPLRGVPVEHNSDGPPCTLKIFHEGVDHRRRAFDTISWLNALARDNNYPDGTRGAANRASRAMVKLARRL